MFGQLFPAIKKLGQSEIEQFSKEDQFVVNFSYKSKNCTFTIDRENTLLSVEISLKSDDKQIVSGGQNFVYTLDRTIDLELKRSYLAREITNRIQKSRKEAGVHIEDRITILINLPLKSTELLDCLETQLEAIQKAVKKPIVFNKNIIATKIGEYQYEIKDEKISIEIVQCAIEVILEQNHSDYQKVLEILKQANYNELIKKDNFKAWLDQKEITLSNNQHYKLL